MSGARVVSGREYGMPVSCSH